MPAATTTTLNHAPRPAATAATTPATISAAMRAFHAVPVADPDSTIPTASWSIGQDGVPIIEAASSVSATAERISPNTELPTSQGRSARASPRSPSRRA